MITRRPADERGRTRLAWLDSRHSFSFGEYHDPAHMGFGVLRVLNEDRVAPGGGFGTHPHRDMEIVTYVIDGELAHRDSTGGGSTIHAGEVQMMRAGTGIFHCEFNASENDPVRFLQIWILPDRKGLEPGYREARVDAAGHRNVWRTLVVPEGEDGPLTISQNARIEACAFDAELDLTRTVDADRRAWIQVIGGALTVSDQECADGDGLAVEGPEELAFTASGPGEALLFDLPR